MKHRWVKISNKALWWCRRCKLKKHGQGAYRSRYYTLQNGTKLKKAGDCNEIKSINT